MEMKLEQKDFRKQFVDRVRYYYFFNNGKIEIDIEPCVGGFCVAVYNEKLDLLEPKKCTDANGYELDVFGIRPRSAFVWNRALEIANEFLARYK